MARGRVAYFNDNKGWGIITDVAAAKDFYVHYTSIRMDGYRTLREGQEVTFEVIDSREGPRAAEVNVTG
jgi:CspA family cold shock protein